MAERKSIAAPIVATEAEKIQTTNSFETEYMTLPQPENGTFTETAAQAKYIDPRSEIGVSLADYRAVPGCT